MISVSEALTCIAKHVPAAKIHKVDLSEASFSILAEDLRAARPLPPFDRVAMDGIAVAALEEGAYEAEDIQFAGEKRKTIANPRGCIEVATGAVLPENGLAVLCTEDLERRGNLFFLKEGRSARPFQNVHRQGSDAKEGELLLAKGSLLTPARIALAASLGKQNLLVKKTPKVSIVSTGDELIPAGNGELQPHQIFSSNAEAILAAVGFRADIYRAKDNLDDIVCKIKKGLLESDILILSGGISLGPKDLVREALEQVGVEKIFYGVWQKPGKPLWFGKTQTGQLVFGLPGNPAAMLISLYVYILPLLGKEREIHAILGENISLAGKYSRFVLCVVSQGIAHPVSSNGSGDLVSLAKADGFILPQTGTQGETVRLWLWC